MAGRFDILAAAPVETLALSASESEAPFEQLQTLYDRYAIELDENSALPFQGGAIGYFGYDLGRALETLPDTAAATANLPDMQVGIYLWALIVDHKQQQAQLIATPQVTVQQLDSIEQRLHNKAPAPTAAFQLTRPFRSNMSADFYQQQLAKVNDYIHAGDCYQVNIAQRFDSEYQGDSWQAYKQLRAAAPTPYSAFIDGEQQILSLSPEQFLQVQQGQVQTKPIKGTRPRADDPATDLALKQELIDSAKDRAENLMIVDLLRNDLSKVCTYKSVRVPKLFNIESYANVHHKVSTVTGELEPGSSPISLLKHCFPGGSITGTPKIRAMEIIEELEPHRRSIYCGSIGYISFCGRMDTSITIRTLLCEHNNIYCWAGGGIVADSDPDMEYAETFSKVNNLLKCLEEGLVANHLD